MPARDNLPKHYPRQHYNKLGKSKQIFESVEQAEEYLNKMHLGNYSIYLCRYCNKYHIAHK